MNKIIEIDHLSFAFEAQETVLDQVTIDFAAQQTVLLTGPSGCGKSTLLRLIAGLLPKYGGTITSGQVNFPKGRPTIGMLFQDPLTQFALDTPRHELEFVLENQQIPTEQIASRVQEALRYCQLTALADRKLATLSGGQQQRVALATVIARQANVLLLDEPFASIDENNRHFLIHQLHRLVADHGVTLIIADHDCHGYQELHPLVYSFAGHQVQKLTSVASQERLAAADTLAMSPLTFPTPTKNDPTSIQLNDVTIKRGQEPLLTQLSLPIIKDKITLVTGPNGAGKSSFFRALTRLLPYQGVISYQGTNIQEIRERRYRQQVGLVFQQANDQFINITVDEELALSKRNGHHPYFNNHLAEAMATLGLTGLEDRVVYSLSGGQRKKLQLLLMLMMDHPVLLLDEPFVGLDWDSLSATFNVIKAAQASAPKTIVIISHRLEHIDQLADFHLTLTNQRLLYREGYHES